MNSRYVQIKFLIANKIRLLFTYNAEFIRYLTSHGSLLTFTKSVVICRCFPNTVPFYKRSKQSFSLSQSLDLNCCSQQANCPQSFRSTTKVRHPKYNAENHFKISYRNISLNVHLLP